MLSDLPASEYPEYYEPKGTKHPGVVYGVYDTKDRCWIGTEYGPILFDDGDEFSDGFMQARVSAEVYDARMGQVAQTRARRYDGTGTQKRDEVTPRISGEKAVELKERGYII